VKAVIIAIAWNIGFPDNGSIEMKNPKLILIIVAIFFFIGVAVLYFFFSNTIDNRNSARQDEMMALVLEWGRLAPFPNSASNVSIQTDGSSFTRSFRASFVAPRQDIEMWVLASSGLSEASPSEISDSQVKYIITPGSGANKAEVIIDFNINRVDIFVSWS
jgi:hypothetical protein